MQISRRSEQASAIAHNLTGPAVLSVWAAPPAPRLPQPMNAAFIVPLPAACTALRLWLDIVNVDRLR